MGSVSSPRRPDADSLPWYRQFWPWFLIALPGSVVVAAITTMVVANRHADDLVVDDYYRDGLAINQRLAQEEYARSQGISARIETLPEGLRIITEGISVGELRLRLFHPLEADRDLALRPRRIGVATYAVTFDGNRLPPRGYWSLDAGPGSDWRLHGRFAEGVFDRGEG